MLFLCACMCCQCVRVCICALRAWLASVCVFVLPMGAVLLFGVVQGLGDLKRCVQQGGT